MTNLSTLAPIGNSARRYQSDPVFLKPDPRRAFEIMGDWLEFSQPGDFAQAIITGDSPASRAVYGSPLHAGRLFFLERLLNRGDLAIVRSFRRPIVLMPLEIFDAMTGAA